jgi:TPP-dependent pyruvate/acetoin dehydrogenase alpha subunit
MNNYKDIKLPELPVLTEIYRKMYLIRRVEETTADIYHTDKIKSPIHLSIGQEPPSVGVCMALRPEDVVFGTYRGHALYLAKGGDLRKMVAELYGKLDGCGKGKAGSMHLGDKLAGVMGTSAIVSSTIPLAVGYALAQRMKKRDTVVPVFFGDGATEEGVFWESLNFAALMKLPVLFVCENNSYAIHTPWTKRVPEQNYCERAAAFGVPASRVENNNVIETYNVACELVSKVRQSGPQFLEVETYRFREHVGPSEDWHLGYRTEEEGRTWIESDEITRIGSMLNNHQRQSIEDECEELVRDAFEFAESSPYPDDEELYRDVFQ